MVLYIDYADSWKVYRSGMKEYTPISANINSLTDLINPCKETEFLKWRKKYNFLNLYYFTKAILKMVVNIFNMKNTFEELLNVSKGPYYNDEK